MALTTCRECNKPLSSEAEACPHCGAKPRAKSGCGTIVLFLLLATILLGILSSLLSSSPPSPSTPAAPSPEDIARTMHNDAMKGLVIRSHNWRKGGFDNVMFYDATIQNKGKYRVRDIRVRCYTYAQSGTQLNMLDQVIYQTVAPGKSVSVHDLNMGFIHPQARTASCDIADFSLL